MNKIDFINIADDFAHWMVGRLSRDQHGFDHAWDSLDRKTGFPVGHVWRCDSVFNAYQNYRWPAVVSGQDLLGFDETAVALDNLRDTLNRSVRLRAGDESRVQIDAVLEWGGVRRLPAIATVLRGMDCAELPGYLTSVRNYFTPSLDTTDVFSHDGLSLQVDSGTTKVYSLICEEYVIFDSRVGAALGLLVRRWGEEIGFALIPEVLRFAWGDNGSQKRPLKRRNPNPPAPNNRKFPFIHNKSVNRTHQNIYANWLLQRVLQLDAARAPGDRSGFADLDPGRRLRALEAALFMIGYCVNDMYTEQLIANVDA